MRAANGKRADEEIRSRLWNQGAVFIFVVFIFVLIVSGRHFTLLDTILTQHEPFRTDYAGPRTQPGLVHISDNVTQIIPSKVFTQEELKQGRLPLWNPRIFCGMPHMADLHSQLFSLTDTPFLLFMSVDNALGASTLLKLILAGYFMYLFCRHLWVDRRLALAAGTVYALSSFTLAWLHFPSFLSTTLYYPLGLLLWDRYLTQFDKRLKLRSQVLLGVVMGLMILGGQLQLFANFVLLALIYSLFSGRGSYEGRFYNKLSGMALPLAIGLVIGAVQLIPALELMYHSTRTGALESNLITDLTMLWTRPGLFFSVLGNFLMKILAMAFPFGWGRVLPTDAQPFPEAVLYVGITILLCFTGSSKSLRGHFDRFLFRFCLVAILVNLFSLLLNSLFSFAGILEFLNPGRCALSALVVLLPLMAVRRIDAYHKGDLNLDEAINRRITPIAVVALLVALIASLFILILQYLQDGSAGIRSMTAALFYLGQLCVMILLTRHLLRAGKVTGRSSTLETLAAAIVAEALLLASVLAFPGAQLTVESIQDNSLNRVFASEKEPFRVVRYQTLDEKDFQFPHRLVKRRSPVLKPNEGMIIGIDDFQGYNSLNPRAFRDYVGLVDDRLVMNIRGSIDLYKPKQVNSHRLDLANVGYILSEEELSVPGIRKVAGGPVNVYQRLNYLPRFGFAGIDPREGLGGWEYRPGYLKLDYSRLAPSEMYFAENKFPGWRVYVNGEEKVIDSQPGTPFMRVFVPGGDHTVEFTYKPASFSWGIILTLLGLATAFLLWLLPSRRASSGRKTVSSPGAGTS